MWEVWKYAKKTIKYKKIVKGDKRGEFFLEDKDNNPVGMIINNKEE